MINHSPKSKRLLLFIGILLLSNLVLLSLMLINKPLSKKELNAEKKAAMTSFLKNEIGFTEQQLQAYDSLGKQHRLAIKHKGEAMKLLKEQQFKMLATENFTDSAIAKVASLNAANQEAIETAIWQYYRSLHRLCTPQQRPRFDALFYGMLNKKSEKGKK